jgi:hypothetical protein
MMNGSDVSELPGTVEAFGRQIYIRRWEHAIQREGLVPQCSYCGFNGHSSKIKVRWLFFASPRMEKEENAW